MSTQKNASDSIDSRLVRKLADILKETDLTEIEIEHGELKIRVARQISAAPMMTTYVPSQAPMMTQALASEPVASAVAAPVAAPIIKDALKSPMVGTVYLQPQPGAANFVKVGDKVKAGQTLLIVEAMKTMNPIPSPKDGVIAQILVADAQPVEFGEALVVFE